MKSWALAGAFGAVLASDLSAQPVPAPSHVAPAAGLAGPLARVTFGNQVVRLFQKSCQSCHHDGGIAPFPLVTYPDAFDHRAQIQIVTSSRRMPPWKPDGACSSFEGNPSLSEAELRTIDRWVAAGAPEGDPRDLPPPLAFENGWAVGTPDVILSMAQPFLPDFGRGDVYRCFVLPPGVAGQRYLRAAEVSPGNRAMVHHVLLFADTNNASAGKDGADGQPGYPCFGGPGFDAISPLGGWVPGIRPAVLPDGIGIDLPAGAPIVMQVHYSARTGGVAPDVTRVGLYFTRGAVQKRLLTLPLLTRSFRLPAGQTNIPVTASFTNVFLPVHVLGIAPHMHLLGRTMTVEATTGGEKVCMVNVPDWDFRWQGSYTYTAGVPLPFGSRLDLTATYDNSAGNPNNPNIPPKDVSWGENTSDEMCVCYVMFTLDYENLSGARGLAATTRETFVPFWEEPWKTDERRPVP
jgi:mono/diheme cytochrome c family protein